MGANNSKSDEKVFQNEVPISFSPDVVNQLSDRLETPDTTPERQFILDSHIRARIRDELEHLKKDEDDVRGQIEHALEKENLDREKSMTSDGDVTSSSILLGDMDQIRIRLEKYNSRREDVEVAAEGDAVIECYKNNKTTPLECWSQVRDFKASVERTITMHFDPTMHPHRRLNPLTKEYVLVSPHRMKRPWLGQTETPQSANLPSYDPNCYLCPGNSRSGGQRNPNYKETFIFENDFPAIIHPSISSTPLLVHPLMTVQPVHGACDVLIFHPKHDLTMAFMSQNDIKRIINEWIRVYESRGSQPGVKYVQIFENKGAMMGCSNPHPHGQIWSLSEVPTIPIQELASLKEYALTTCTPTSSAPRGLEGRPCMLCEYAHTEFDQPQDQSRVVVSNQDWVSLVPWWAIWPFEILVLPYRRHIESISQLNEDEKASFADILARITRRYDNLFSCSFAYSMGIHQKPVPGRDLDRQDHDHEDNFAHLHLHFEPPLLRSSSIKKFLVGYELMAEPQRDLTPEQAAECLRQCDDHYVE